MVFVIFMYCQYCIEIYQAQYFLFFSKKYSMSSMYFIDKNYDLFDDQNENCFERNKGAISPATKNCLEWKKVNLNL